MNALASRVGLSLLTFALVSSAHAATTLKGQISASITLTGSCQIVGGGKDDDALKFGKLDFGTTNTGFTDASAEVLGQGGGALSIRCSKGANPTVKLGGGDHDGKSEGGSRALADNGGNFVPYDLYADAGHTQVLKVGSDIPLGVSDGEAQDVKIYGRAVGKDNLPAGKYSDTIAVELSF